MREKWRCIIDYLLDVYPPVDDIVEYLVLNCGFSYAEAQAFVEKLLRR